MPIRILLQGRKFASEWPPVTGHYSPVTAFSGPWVPPLDASHAAALHESPVQAAQSSAGKNDRVATDPCRRDTPSQSLSSRKLSQASQPRAALFPPPSAPQAPTQTCNPFRAI